MAKKKSTNQTTHIIEDESTKVIWTYDPEIAKSGPISVEIQYKDEQQILTHKKSKNEVRRTKNKRV